MTTTAARMWKHSVSEITSLFGGSIWPVTLGLMLALTLLSTGLGLTDSSHIEYGPDFNPGRSATTLTALVALVIGLISGPVVMNGARKDDQGPASVVTNLVVGVVVGGSLVLAALPALLWGFSQSSLSFGDMFALVATLKFEVLAVTLISAMIHVAIVRRGIATAVSGAIILAITVVPAGVSSLAATVNGVEQVETYIGIEWTDETKTDPDTGIAIDPICAKPTYMTTWQSDPSRTWQILAISPLVTLAESIPASVISDHGFFTSEMYGGNGVERFFPSDTLSSLSTEFRQAQKPVPTTILRDECAAVKNGTMLDYGYPGEISPDWQDGTTSGYGIGILTQAGVLVLVTGSAVIAHLRRRRPQ